MSTTARSTQSPIRLSPSYCDPRSRVRDQLLHDRCLTLDEIAKSHGLVPSYATRLCRLTLLAPISLPLCSEVYSRPDLPARKLMDDTRLPLDWNEQRRALGFVQSH